MRSRRLDRATRRACRREYRRLTAEAALGPREQVALQRALGLTR